jgi:hypothetical protein
MKKNKTIQVVCALVLGIALLAGYFELKTQNTVTQPAEEVAFQPAITTANASTMDENQPERQTPARQNVQLSPWNETHAFEIPSFSQYSARSVQSAQAAQSQQMQVQVNAMQKAQYYVFQRSLPLVKVEPLHLTYPGYNSYQPQTQFTVPHYYMDEIPLQNTASQYYANQITMGNTAYQYYSNQITMGNTAYQYYSNQIMMGNTAYQYYSNQIQMQRFTMPSFYSPPPTFYVPPTTFSFP